MEIGQKLKDARIRSGLTQENVAESIDVSRQTISNWANEKSYPDIMSVIKLSDLYSISLDDLLKGDKEMIEHLEESTNVVSSNKKLITAIVIQILLIIVFVVLNVFMAENQYYLAGVFCLVLLSSTALFYQIIKKF